MTETRWWWIRHAPVPTGKDHIYGQRDLDADCLDRACFETLADLLPKRGVLVTSDLKRTIQTAEATVSAGFRPVETRREVAFREQHFGDWQGIARAEFGKIRDSLAHRFWLAPAYERAPNGESFADLIARTAPAVTRLTAEFAGEDIVCVAHGGTIRAALAIALGLDAESTLSFSIANCSLTRLDHIMTSADQGCWRVSMVNRATAAVPDRGPLGDQVKA